MLSNGSQSCPRSASNVDPLSMSRGEEVARQSGSGLRSAAAPDRWGAESSEPVLEAPALVAGFDDVAVLGRPVEECGGHLGVAEDGRPPAEGEVRGDDDGVCS